MQVFLLLLFFSATSFCFQIFLNGMSNKTNTIEINNNMTVLQLKELIKNDKDIPTKEQMLIFEGKILQDDMLLSAYGIKKDSLLQLLLRLRGD